MYAEGAIRLLLLIFAVDSSTPLRVTVAGLSWTANQMQNFSKIV